MPVHFHMCGPLFRVRRCVCAEYIRTPRRRRRKSRPRTLSLPGRSRKSAGLPETPPRRGRHPDVPCRRRIQRGRRPARFRTPRSRRRGRKPEIGLQICKNGGNFLFLGFEKINPATPISIMKRTFLLTAALLAALSAAAQWQPAGDRIKTVWGENLDPQNVLPEYPRPQLVLSLIHI